MIVTEWNPLTYKTRYRFLFSTSVPPEGDGPTYKVPRSLCREVRDASETEGRRRLVCLSMSVSSSSVEVKTYPHWVQCLLHSVRDEVPSNVSPNRVSRKRDREEGRDVRNSWNLRYFARISYFLSSLSHTHTFDITRVSVVSSTSGLSRR